jgi:deoxyribonuclease V
MIAAFDVHYRKEGGATGAAVLFSNITDDEAAATYTHFLPYVAEYIPGKFYLRELPVILMLLKQITEKLDAMIIDGYVMLGDRPGLGQHLYMATYKKIPVIGVAKSEFKGAMADRIFRGKSSRPLYVTSAGVCLHQAAATIQSMHGIGRIPTLLKKADFLSRQME